VDLREEYDISVTMKASFDKTGFLLIVAVVTMQATISYAFITPQPAITGPSMPYMRKLSTKHGDPLFMSETEGENQVVELADDETDEQPASESKTGAEKLAAAAPFISQGEIDEEALTMNWSDPQQQRVIFYIILSLLPVLFLVPLMLGSRELIPQELLPPVEL